MAKTKQQAEAVAPTVTVALDTVTEGGSYIVNPETGAVERVAFMQTNATSVQALIDQQAAENGKGE